MNGDSIAFPLQVPRPDYVIVLTAGNLNYCSGLTSSGTIIVQSFVKVIQDVQKLKWTHTDTHTEGVVTSEAYFFLFREESRLKSPT